MKSRLKIGLSIWMFKPGTGGLQSHAEHLARYLIARGHEVTVITKSFTKVPERLEFLYFSENPDSGEVGGVPVRAVNYSLALRPLQWFIAKAKDKVGLKNLALSLYRWQAKIGNDKLYRGFDIIHHVGQATALLGFAAADGARKWRTPFVVQPTCHPYQIGDSPLDLKLYRLADRALVHTQYEAAHLRPMLGAMPIDVVGNGIEDRTDGVGERFRDRYAILGPMILYIGRRDADKGYGHVTQAFRLVKQKQPDATLVCMGPAGGLEKVEEPGILNFDFVDELTKHDALAACDCLCVPSEGESFGLVYMEAGRYAKPVIARRLPVLEELLEGGKAGLLVGRANPSKNENRLETEELSDQILNLIQNPRLAVQIGEECRRVSGKFIWPEVVKKFDASYQRVVKRV
jgi:glycosyltransferase involved in cell wall biosynthesis